MEFVVWFHLYDIILAMKYLPSKSMFLVCLENGKYIINYYTCLDYT